jgi:hypothetical protein
VLDTVSSSLSTAAQTMARMSPEIPQALDPRRLARLLKDAKGTEAIGSLQNLVAQTADAAPATVTGDAGGVALRKLALSLERANPAQAMADAHTAAQWFQQAKQSATDEVSQEFAARTEQALRTELTQQHWGTAGQQYAALVAPPHPALEGLANPEQLRGAMVSGSLDLEKTLDSVQNAITAAHDARFKLTGDVRPPELGRDMKQLGKLFQAGQAAVTIDGAPLTNRLRTAQTAGIYGQKADKIDGLTVQNHVESGLEKVQPLIEGFKPTLRAIGSGEVGRETERELYDKRMKELARSTARPDAAANYPMQAAISSDVGGKMAQLMADIPKPANSIHGKPLETLSRDDLRLANAMWEATTEPMSVFDDLARGQLDPDKAAYAWKQYPGLQKAAQAGVIDVLMSLPEDKRSTVPEHIITQLDTALGFNGTLQDSNEPAFAARMGQLFQPPQKPPGGGMLENPKARPSFTERLSGQQE